jgi:hypothetical protein
VCEYIKSENFGKDKNPPLEAEFHCETCRMIILLRLAVLRGNGIVLTAPEQRIFDRHAQEVDQLAAMIVPPWRSIIGEPVGADFKAYFVIGLKDGQWALFPLYDEGTFQPLDALDISEAGEELSRLISDALTGGNRS